MSANANTELNALKFVMASKDPEVLVKILPEHFGNLELQKIFLLIRGFYLANSTFPGWDVLKSKVAGACSTTKKADFLLSLLSQVEERDISGLTTSNLLIELEEYRKFRLMLTKTNSLVSAIEDKDSAKALGKLKEMHDEVFYQTSAIELESADMASRAGKPITFNFTTTGIKPIDERGGLIDGGYTIIAAVAKAGKSTLAGQIAMHQYLKENANVAYFTLEMQYEELRARLMANLADIDVGSITENTLTDEERVRLRKREAAFYCDGTENLVVDLAMDDEKFFEYVLDTFPRRQNTFYIFDDRLDWDTLWVKMELLATTKNVKTFVIDYPYLIDRGSAYKDLSSWEYNLQQSKNLKTFAHKHKARVITPAQLDPGKDGKDPKLKFVSNQINNCDLCLFLTHQGDDKELNQITVKFEAYRNFRSIPNQPLLMPFVLHGELQHSRFIYMDY